MRQVYIYIVYFGVEWLVNFYYFLEGFYFFVLIVDCKGDIIDFFVESCFFRNSEYWVIGIFQYFFCYIVYEDFFQFFCICGFYYDYFYLFFICYFQDGFYCLAGFKQMLYVKSVKVFLLLNIM